MKLLHFTDHNKLSEELAEHIFQSIQTGLKERGSFVLGLATGKSPKLMYKKLIKLLGNASLNLSGLHTFNLDEYYPIKQSHPQSYFQEMYHCFWKPLNEQNSSFEIPNGHILNGENPKPELECRIYEKMIERAGGIDIQILGLGINGHIGFNEPGSPPESQTRKVELAAETREANQYSFGDDLEKVPTHGLTMGIQTILKAKQILLIVTGETKRDIFTRIQHLSEPTPDIPASYLLNHPEVLIYSDLPQL